MRIGHWIAVIGCVVASALPASGEVMYGSTGGGTPRGVVGIVSQTDATFTFLGDPTSGGDKLVGLSFDASGRLFGIVVSDSPGSTLIQINPVDGTLISTIGKIQDSSSKNIKIVDLATQPGTDVLFGVDDGRPTSLWTISKSTAVATLVGNTGIARGGLAFAPNGTLYLATTDDKLAILDPATGMVIGTPIDLSACFDGLAVRPSDGALFGTECESNNIDRIDPTTGDVTVLGAPEDNDVADLAFKPVPPRAAAPTLSPAAITLLATALVAMGVLRLIRQRRAEG